MIIVLLVQNAPWKRSYSDVNKFEMTKQMTTNGWLCSWNVYLPFSIPITSFTCAGWLCGNWRRHKVWLYVCALHTGELLVSRSHNEITFLRTLGNIQWRNTQTVSPELSVGCHYPRSHILRVHLHGHPHIKCEAFLCVLLTVWAFLSTYLSIKLPKSGSSQGQPLHLE